MNRVRIAVPAFPLARIRRDLAGSWAGGVAALAISVCSFSVAAAETGTLKMRFVYGGDAPKAAKVDPNKDTEFCGKHDLVDESLLVNSENNGIKNVVLYVYTGRGGSELPEMPLSSNKKTLANDKCRFEPHIVIAQTGDTLAISNPDPVGHNANLNFFRNQAQNLMIPSDQTKEVTLSLAEPAPIPVECNIHPWMKAYVVVLEHPFVAASDDDGSLTIEGLPTGKELSFRVYHEKGKIDDVKVAGKDASWSRGKFEMMINPGMNDAGDVVIPADAFN